MPTLQAAGVGITTTDEVFVDQGDLRGSIFQIFVPVRARVEFYRGSQLIDTQTLEYGLQEINTARFPQGSYFVDIIIKEIGGAERRQRVFYSKSGTLVPQGQPTLFLQGGLFRNQTDFEDFPVFSTGVRWRAFDSAQLELSSYGVDDKSAGIVGTRGIIGDSLWGIATSLSTNDDVGISVDLSSNLFGLNFGGYYERSDLIVVDNSDIFFFDTPDNIATPATDEVIFQRGETLNAYIAKQFDRWEFRLESFEINDENLNRTYYYGPLVRWRLWEGIKHFVGAEAAYQKTNDGNRSYASISYQYRFGNWNTDSTGSYVKDDIRDDKRLVNSLNYDSKESLTQLGARGQIRNEVLSQKESDVIASSADINVGQKYFGAGGYIQNLETVSGNDSNQGNNNSGAFTFDSSQTISGDGKITSSPAGLGRSLIVVEIKSSNPLVRMDVVVNGGVVSRNNSPGTVVLGVNPYRKYQVSIAPSEGSPIVDYDTSIKEFTLYPGNVSHASFKAEKVVIAIGKIVNANNMPLSFARIKVGTRNFLTEEDGSFQIEMMGAEPLEIKYKGSFCKIVLPQQENVEYFYDFGKVSCVY